MRSAVYLAQLLCPERHCIVANARFCSTPQDVESLASELRAAFAAGIKNKLWNPWCGLCRCMALHVETGRTAYATMKEAAPALKAAAEAQRVTAEFLKAGRN